MLTRRIIPCLDILDGRVVKGRKFENLIDIGDPVELAAQYSREGADELVLLDISATLENRRPFFEVVRDVASAVAIPLTVGGGIRELDDILRLLKVGADKVSLNSILVQDPTILETASAIVGSQALVAALDVKREGDGWTIHVKSGKQATGLDALAWAERVVSLGAGELLITSIDRDGTKEGYDLDFLAAVAKRVSVPIIASGGAGSVLHLTDALTFGQADAVLAASLFHFREIGIQELKTRLASEGIPVRAC